MDGVAASAIKEDEAGDKPRDGDTAAGNNPSPSAENTADRVFCCRDCGEGFREEAAYLEHRHQHPQESMYLDNQSDGLHDAQKDNETVNFCTLCSLSFVEPSEFFSHMEKSHGQTAQKEPSGQIHSGITKQHTYECPDCGKCYGVIGHFLNHQRSHRQASKSVFHDLEHLKKKSFQCESCGRNYSRASALDAHRRCHEEKLVKSRNKSSGNAFHTEGSIVEAKPNENQTVDTPEKTFTCLCGKAFTALLRLKTHQRFSRNIQCSTEEMKDRVRKSVNEFYCNECKKDFNSHIALFNHQRWHVNHLNYSANRFLCEECGKVFMTQTFYFRHQRMAHSDETPAKSFLHQVCQLQKKAFECKECGLKFSRASALHSHQLHHTDVFRETKEALMQTSVLPQQETLESVKKEAEQDTVESDNVLSASVAEEDSLVNETENVLSTIVAKEDPHVNETDEDAEGYDPRDFNVQVISASESEDETVQDLNPDLELLCESDQEVRDDGDAGVSTSRLFSKPGMDLKIVEIDFEQTDEQCALIAGEAENKTGARFDCPECPRWFSSASSLRVHRMWHGVRKRKRQTQGQSVAVHTCDTCGHEANSYAAHCSHIQKHKTQNTSGGDEAEGLEKKNLACTECGKNFTRLSALVSHQLHHPKRKLFQCPDCMMSYSHAASLFNHVRNCSAQKKENISDIKKEYNPKKTLLGPKIYHCERCEKGFWSLGAYSHHKQSQTQCTDLRLTKGGTGSLHSVNGHPRFKVACPVCGRKFRHKGIMALHMRKHENGNHKCELCSRSFRLFSSLLRHQVVHSDQLLPPPIKSFQHQVDQLKKNTYSCPDCGKLFSRAKALQFHMKSHGYETGHSPSSPSSTVALEDLQCATCLAHFNNKASLRAHRKLCIKRGSQVVICKTEPSENNDTLTLHENTMAVTQESSKQTAVHTEVKQEMVSGEQKMEIETHEGNLKSPITTNLKYKCTQCDRSFSVVGALNFHKRIHAEGYKSVAKAKMSKQEEPSKVLIHCPDCGRRFMSNASLGSHKRWHKEKKCSRSSLKDDDLKSSGHKTEDGPFQCHKCDKLFFNRHVLQRHQTFNPLCRAKTAPHADSNHTVEGEFSCPECHKTFEQGSLLDAHYENEHSDTADQVPNQVDVYLTESTSSTLKPKAHQCPLCSMTFVKARGLRAHKWQAHSKRKGKNKARLRIKTEAVTSSSELTVTEGSSAATVKNTPVGREKKKIRSDPPFVKFISCLDCGKQCSSPGIFLEHKKVCLGMKREAKQEIQNPESMAEVSQPLSRLSAHTAKCLFKCDKCGKAFQTEEQLGVHKTKAESRPYCCALCCHPFWTENQLQQHLAWHDEVRCRLPNEVRLRLRAAMTSRPSKPSGPSADTSRASSPSSTLSSDSQSQSSHKCQHCGKAFLSPTALQKHESQHFNNDLYHCSICPRTFSDIQDLIDHHQDCVVNECSIVCEDCGLRFTDWDVFKTHLHQHALEDEEEEEAQTGDATSPAAELDSGKVDYGENTGGDADGRDMSSSLQTNPSGCVDEATGSATNQSGKIYTCLVCGKAYTYWSSFKKHQILHEELSVEPESSKYQCPECGLSFIRRARLLGHLRVHWSLTTKNPRCDECDKDFTSVRSWLSHAELHKRKPFWCTSCSRGFADKRLLNVHLLRHNQKEYTCNICLKNFEKYQHLRVHYNTHAVAKPFQCTFCGKSFSQPGNLRLHRKKMHRRVYVRSSGMHPGINNAAKQEVIGKKRLRSHVKEEREKDTDTEELPRMEEHGKTNETGEPCEDAEFGPIADPEEFHCGEPVHRGQTLESDGVQQELYKSESPESNVRSEHKQWECVECDMGFDEVAKLHLHYIKHATGELPMPQYDSEG